MNGRDTAGNDAVGEDFAATLDELKHRGRLHLVTDDIGTSVRTRQTRRLFRMISYDRQDEYDLSSGWVPIER